MTKEQKQVLQAQLDDEKEVLNRLKRQYKKAANDILDRIRSLQDSMDILNEELAEAQTIEEANLIRSKIQAKAYQKSYQEAIKKNVDVVINNMNNSNQKTIEGYFKDCYDTGFIGTMYDITGQGIPIIVPIEPEKVANSLKLDAKLSKKLYGTYVTTMKKQIQAEISRGFATGLSYSQTAKNLQNVTNVGFNKTMRIVRTEGHRIQIQSAMDAQDEAKKKGADVLKQWNSVLDGRTRPHHRKLDGQLRELDEDFEIAGMKVKAPGMFGKPEEDINCRCALDQRARWALDEAELDTLKERAKFFGLDADSDKIKDFEDYKKKYLKATESVRSSSQKINNKSTSKEKVEEKEYKTLTDDEALKMREELGQTKEDFMDGKPKFKSDYNKVEKKYFQTTNSYEVNKALRSGDIDEETQKVIDAMDKYMKPTPEDLQLYRAVNGDKYFKALGIDGEITQSKLDGIVGNVINEKGYMSCCYSKDALAKSEVKLNIKCDKGTNVLFSPTSDVDGIIKEHEVVLGRGTSLQIEKVSISKDANGNSTYEIFAKTVPENPLEINGKNDIIKVTKRKQLDTGYNTKIPDDKLEEYNKKALEQIKQDTRYSDEKATELHNAFMDYFGGDYEKILSGETETAKIIKNGLKDMPVYDGTIYRGMVFTKEDVKKFSDLKAGDSLPKKGLIESWSSNERAAISFGGANDYYRSSVILECVDNHTGVGVQHISKFGSREAEVLTSTNYEVVDVVVENKYDYLSKHKELLYSPDDLEWVEDDAKENVVCRIIVKEKN